MLEDREYMTQDRFDVWLNAKLYQPDFQIDEAFLRDLFQFETDEFLIDFLYHVFVGKYMGGYPKEHLIDLLCEIQSVPHLIDHERTLYQTDRLVDMIEHADDHNRYWYYKNWKYTHLLNDSYNYSLLEEDIYELIILENEVLHYLDEKVLYDLEEEKDFQKGQRLERTFQRLLHSTHTTCAIQALIYDVEELIVDNDYYTEIMKLLEGRKQILTSLHEDKIERRSLSLFHDGRLITVDYGDTESNIDKTVQYMDQVYKEDYGSERYQNTLFH